MKHTFLHASIGRRVKIMTSFNKFSHELNLCLTNVNNNKPLCSVLLGDLKVSVQNGIVVLKLIQS